MFPKYTKITTHVARHSFVTNAIYSGANNHLIKSITGHGAEKMINRYFNQNNEQNKVILEGIFKFIENK